MIQTEYKSHKFSRKNLDLSQKPEDTVLKAHASSVTQKKVTSWLKVTIPTITVAAMLWRLFQVFFSVCNYTTVNTVVAGSSWHFLLTENLCRLKFTHSRVANAGWYWIYKQL